jgi:hypothetical protein
MRIAVVSVPAKSKGISGIASALAKGMESMGHRVDVLDAWTEDGFRLPGYEYIAVVAEKRSFFGGKLPEVLGKVLSSALGGKKGAAFLIKSGPFNGKAMANLMRTMEKEGIVVNWSDLLLNPPHAETLGKRIGA